LTGLLLVESEVHQIVVPNDVVFGFEAQFVRVLGLGFAACGDEVREADDFGADEPLLDVGVDGSRGFRRRHALLDEPRAVFRAAHREIADVAALAQHADQEFVELLQVGGRRHDNRLGGQKCVCGHRLQLRRRQPGGGDEPLVLQRRLDLAEHGFLRLRRVALEPLLHELQVVQNHIEPAGRRHDDGIGGHGLLPAGNVHLDVGFFLRLHQLVSLVEARVLDVVFSQRDAGETEEADFHAKRGSVEESPSVEKTISRRNGGAIHRDCLVTPSRAGWAGPCSANPPRNGNSDDQPAMERPACRPAG